MELINVSADLLKTILTEKKAYFDVINEYAKSENIEEPSRIKITQLIGTFLRNYYFLKHVERFLFDSKDINVLIHLGLCFANNAYLTIYPKDECLQDLKDYLKSIKRDLDQYREVIFKKICEEKRAYYFQDLKKGSFKYFSVKLNLPEWFVKMMVKQYGADTGIKTCKEMARMPKQYAILNPFKLLNGDVKTAIDKDFDLYKDNIYVYKSKTSLRKNQLIKKKDLFQIQLASLSLLDELEEYKHSNIGVYLGNKNNIYFLVLDRVAKNSNNVSIITKHMYENYDLLSKIKEYKIQRTHFQEANEDGLDAFLSNKQDLFLYFAESSEIENFRLEPDYSIFFDNEALDKCIENEKNGLENISKHVNVNGTLVYCVKTLGKKETSNIISEFIENHPEFSLVKEKQFFPFEEENSVYYYAILRKNS